MSETEQPPVLLGPADPTLDRETGPRGLDRELGAWYFGYRVAVRRSGYPLEPWMYQLQTAAGESVGHPGGGFFGWGWQRDPATAWTACPHFAEDLRAAWKLLRRILELGGLRDRGNWEAQITWNLREFRIHLGGSAKLDTAPALEEYCVPEDLQMAHLLASLARRWWLEVWLPGHAAQGALE